MVGVAVPLQKSRSMTQVSSPIQKRQKIMGSPMRRTPKLLKSLGSPINRSCSMSRIPNASSPCQKMARKLVRKYSLGSRLMGQRKELSNLRSSLPHMKHATDLELVLGAINYIQQLQQRVVMMSSNSSEKEKK